MGIPRPDLRHRYNRQAQLAERRGSEILKEENLKNQINVPNSITD